MSLGPSPTQEQLDKQEYLNKKLKEFLGTNKKFPDEFPHHNKLIGNESYQIK